MRVTAGVSVDTVAPPEAKNSEVSTVAGTSSSASVTVAFAGPQPGESDTATTASAGSASTDDSSDASGSSDTETSQDATTAPPQEVAAVSINADTETDASADEKATADSANDDSVGDTTSATAPDAAEDDATPQVEAAEADETAPATASVDASPAAEAATPAETPSYDASVVLKVSPPPDDVKAAPDATANDETPPAATKETQTAAVTPSNGPVPDEATPADDETPAAAEAEPGTDAPGSDESATPGEGAEQPTAAEDTEPSDAGAEPVEVEQPPAHPIVAAIRAKLADPSFHKHVPTADLKALEDFYGTHEGPPVWISDSGFSDKAKALIGEIGKADDWGLETSAFDVPRADAHPATEEDQAAAELKLALAALKYARYAEGGRRSPSSYSSLFDQRPHIRNPKIVLTELAAASAPDSYLTSLHPQHEQFKRLHQALLNARAKAEASGRKPGDDRDVQLIVMNMERWRWLPRQLGSLYVWNNVPEFNTRVIKNGKTIYVEKVIVGQLKYATPFFSAPMRNIVFHPNWTVPPTIVNEDIAPKLQSDGGFFGNANTAVLRRHGLKVSRGGKPVDPDSVDWDNVNVRAYTFTQDPGPANVLGRLKFNFPNKHAIYMHDTVQPELFNETVRSMSHGCIRVHDPDQFAAVLLGQDKGWSLRQVKDQLAKDQTSVVGLNRRIPVHITYFTAVVGENGNLNRLGDIYGLDNRMAKKMFRNPASFPVPASPVDVETASRSRSRTSGLDNFISGLFGN